MYRPQRAIDSLDRDLVRVRDDQLVELTLDDLGTLLSEPDVGAFTARRGPYRTGLEDLALTLSAAGSLPDELTVRVFLPTGADLTVPTAQVQAALRRQAADAASASWREAMAVRSMGRRQIPVGVPVAIVSAFTAYGAGYLATIADSTTISALFVVVAMVAITVAWVVSWMVIESATLDWRQAGRKAGAYDLLARATLEVVIEESPSASAE